MSNFTASTAHPASFRATPTGRQDWLLFVSRWHLAIVLGVAALARLWILFQLDTVTTGWHAVDYGAIARNFYRHGFRLLWPQVDWGGDGPGYVETEFPIIPYVTALFYAIAGKADDRLAVIVPLVSGMLTVYFTYQLTRRLFRADDAFWVGIFLAVSPVFVRYSQMFFPEATLLACSSGAIYAAVRWQQTERGWYLAASAVATSLAVLLKPTALILGAPLLWVFWLRDGIALWKRPALYAYGLVALVPAVLWYWHAWQLAHDYGNSFGILFGGGSNKMAPGPLLTTTRFYTKLAERLVIYHLTAVGAISAVWAAVRTTFTREQKTVVIWAAVAGLSLFVVAVGNDQAPYYQLPFVVPACIFAGLGFRQLLDEVALLRSSAAKAAIRGAMAICLVAGVVFGSIEHYRRSDYVSYMWAGRVASLDFAKRARPNALIVFTAEDTMKLPRGQHVTPPSIFYFGDHHGWYLETDWLTTSEIEALRARGAEYFVVENYRLLRDKRPDIMSYLDRSFARVPSTSDELWTWDMTQPVSPAPPAPVQ